MQLNSAELDPDSHSSLPCAARSVDWEDKPLLWVWVYHTWAGQSEQNLNLTCSASVSRAESSRVTWEQWADRQSH